MAHQQLRLKDMTSDDVIKPGQKKRQKCDQQDNILLCLIERGQQGSERSYPSLSSNENLCKHMPVVCSSSCTHLNC